ncbi:MAG: hypothetical protein K0R27_2487 [Xanthobacteraceae bacterium]|jgi:hypothetical protein|nr:hypothetical protein [Xanthobacteraceae bacterium]
MIKTFLDKLQSLAGERPSMRDGQLRQLYNELIGPLPARKKEHPIVTRLAQIKKRYPLLEMIHHSGHHLDHYVSLIGRRK